jgi:aspartate/methionine/tyrosine aminotransferase
VAVRGSTQCTHAKHWAHGRSIGTFSMLLHCAATLFHFVNTRCAVQFCYRLTAEAGVTLIPVSAFYADR